MIFLLFLVGLEQSVECAYRPSITARFAMVGMFTPFMLGLMVAWMASPDHSLGALLFIAAPLVPPVSALPHGLLMNPMCCVHGKPASSSRQRSSTTLGLISLAIVSGIVVSGSLQVM